MLSRNVIENLIDSALHNGCDYIELFIENSKKTSKDISNGILTRFNTNNSCGIGIRAFSNSVFSYISTNDFSEKNLFSIIKDISNSVYINDVSKKHCYLPALKDHNRQDHTKGGNQETEIEEMLIRLTRKIKSSFPLVVDAVGTDYQEKQNVLIANSNGLFVEDNRARVRLTFDIFASNGTEQHNLSFSCGETMNEKIFENIDFESECFDVAETTIKFLDATHAPVGLMPVVIDNGFGAIIFHEACGHSLEATSVVNNTSVFSNKLNTQISNGVITMVDDGSFKNAWGTSSLDDEGNPTKENILIKNGVLKSFLLDNITSKKLGIENNNSCRRESYKYPPSPRMSNTYIKNGVISRDDIISSVDYGILIKGIGGGAANPSNGDFEFTSNESYLIERGKITKPLRTITLIGNGCEILNKVELIGNNLKLSEGYCGSVSGNIPITVGQPTIKISELNIGGVV